MPLSSKRLQESVSTEKIATLFFYDPHTGIVTNKKTGHSFTKETRMGYLCMGYKSKSFLVHRVAWLLYHGYWPEYEIDHANGVKSDNRIKNLRSAMRSQNIQNTKLRSDNSTGYKGVTWSAAHGKYRARINTNDGKRIHVGLYHTPEAAAEALRIKRKQLHGKFCNHG